MVKKCQPKAFQNNNIFALKLGFFTYRNQASLSTVLIKYCLHETFNKTIGVFFGSLHWNVVRLTRVFTF